MGNKKDLENIQLLEPKFFDASYSEHEISLVDLWIDLTRHKLVFISVASLLLLLGLYFSIFVFSEKRTLTSALQVGSFTQGSATRLVESTGALKSKLDNVVIPNIVADWMARHPDSPRFNIEVFINDDSDVVLVQNRIKEVDRARFEGIHGLITQAVIRDHDGKIADQQVDLSAELELEKRKLADLLDENTLPTLLGAEQSILKLEERKFERLGETITALNDRVGAGNTSETLQRQQFLLQTRLKQDEVQRNIDLSRLRLAKIEQKHREKISEQGLVVRGIEEKLAAFNRTKLVSAPVLSNKPTGMTRTKLVLIVTVLALGAGVAAMLLALFLAKVKERRQALA